VPCSFARSTASAILRLIRVAPTAAALISHASAPGPSARNAASSRDLRRLARIAGLDELEVVDELEIDGHPRILALLRAAG
jgi:hypothetical protein